MANTPVFLCFEPGTDLAICQRAVTPSGSAYAVETEGGSEAERRWIYHAFCREPPSISNLLNIDKTVECFRTKTFPGLRKRSALLKAAVRFFSKCVAASLPEPMFLFGISFALFGAAMAAFNSRLAQPVFGVGANNGRQLKQEARFNTALIGATFVVCGSFMVLAALR